jgi:hypothetical protein
MNAPKLLLIAAAVGALPSIAAASCGAAFCSVNSNWTSESALVDSGSSFDLRYEYIRQDQPRTGTDDIAVGQIPHHHDEVSTVNRNLVASYSRSFAGGWGMSVVAPVVDRNHTHIHNHRGEQLIDRWSFTELGDVRVMGRYQLPLTSDAANPGTVGVSFGVKLPTGQFDVANGDGDVAERSLQPGSGTTDAIVGAYYHRKLPQMNSSWFAQAQYQRALKERDGFKPGAQFGADVGYRYAATEKLGLLAQLNAVVKRRDSGAEAEPDDSGSRSVFLSPGVSYAVADNMEVYAFYQHPVYQKVNGVQLTAPRALVIGISGRF